jgi:WD40 repeat protein
MANLIVLARAGLALTLTLMAAVALAARANAQEQPRIEVVPRVAHGGPITSAAFSPDGARVVTASYDTTLKLWDVATRRLIRTFVRHSNEGIIRHVAVAFSPDGTRVVSGCVDGMKLWDVATGRLIRAFEVNSFFRYTSVQTVVFSPDGKRLLAGLNDGAAELWDVAGGRRLQSFAVGSRRAPTVAFSPDSTHVLTGVPDGTAKLWDAATGKLVGTFGTPPERHQSYPAAVAFSPDGKRIAVGVELSGSTLRRRLELWEADSRKLIRSLEGRFGVDFLNFASQGTVMLGGGGLELFDVETGRLTPIVTKRVLAVAHDGKRALLGDADEITLALWDSRAESLTPLVGQDHRLKLAAVAVSQDARQVLAAGRAWPSRRPWGESTLSLWDLTTGRLVRTTVLPRDESIEALVPLPEGVRAVLGGRSGLRLWDAEKEQSLRRFPVRPDTVSADGSRMAKIDGRGVALWDVAAGKVLRTFEEGANAVTAVAISPDGTRIAAGSNEGRTRVWDAATGDLLHTFDVPWSWRWKRAMISTWRNPITALAFSADGRHLVDGRHGFDDDLKRMRLWDVKSGRSLRTFDFHPGGYRSIAIAPDNRHILTVGRDPYSGGLTPTDMRIHLWDAKAGRVLHSFDGHSGGGRAATLTRDGRLVLSVSQDGTIRAWMTESGQLLATLLAEESSRWLAVTPEGFFAASDQAAATELLTIVRGLQVSAIDASSYQVLHRPDLVQAKLAGDPDGRVKKAAATLEAKLR